MSKPKKIILWDGKAQCISEDYDDMGGGAFCVEVDATLYSSEQVEKLQNWLNKARAWIKRKEET